MSLAAVLALIALAIAIAIPFAALRLDYRRQIARAVAIDREACASEVRLLMAMRGRQECCSIGASSGMGGPPECCCEPRVMLDAEDVIDAILVRRPGLTA